VGNGGKGREEGEVKGRGLVPPHMTCLHDAPAHYVMLGARPIQMSQQSAHKKPC